MVQATIRELQSEEVAEVFIKLAPYAFRPTPPLPDIAEYQEILQKRRGCTYFALYEDGAPVASVASSAMTQNVRGNFFGMGGIWGVATRPFARRKGYSRRLLARLMLSNRENGRPLSCLYPFRESFYERLGYVNFPKSRKVRLNINALLPLARRALDGEVELVLLSDGFKQYNDYLVELRAHTHGMALFEYPDESRAERSNLWLALARVDRRVVAAMIYHIKGDRPTEFKMTALRFYYSTSRGKYLLLAWIARHIDQANEVEIHLAPSELPETWVPDMVAGMEQAWRAPMGRVLDVAGLSGMQVGEGNFTARIVDPLCPWNEGNWSFESRDGKLQVGTTGKAACELSIQALSALVYGTHNLDDFVHRGWGNPPPDLVSTLRRMFPAQLPYLHEDF